MGGILYSNFPSTLHAPSTPCSIPTPQHTTLTPPNSIFHAHIHRACTKNAPSPVPFIQQTHLSASGLCPMPVQTKPLQQPTSITSASVSSPPVSSFLHTDLKFESPNAVLSTCHPEATHPIHPPHPTTPQIPTRTIQNGLSCCMARLLAMSSRRRGEGEGTVGARIILPRRRREVGAQIISLQARSVCLQVRMEVGDRCLHRLGEVGKAIWIMGLRPRPRKMRGLRLAMDMIPRRHIGTRGRRRVMRARDIHLRRLWQERVRYVRPHRHWCVGVPVSTAHRRLVVRIEEITLSRRRHTCEIDGGDLRIRQPTLPSRRHRRLRLNQPTLPSFRACDLHRRDHRLRNRDWGRYLLMCPIRFWGREAQSRGNRRIRIWVCIMARMAGRRWRIRRVGVLPSMIG